MRIFIITRPSTKVKTRERKRNGRKKKHQGRKKSALSRVGKKNLSRGQKKVSLFLEYVFFCRLTFFFPFIVILIIRREENIYKKNRERSLRALSEMSNFISDKNSMREKNCHFYLLVHFFQLVGKKRKLDIFFFPTLVKV